MKNVFATLLLMFSVGANAGGDRPSLLAAWEALQLNNEEVVSFKKIADKRYLINFVTLPFEGELTVLAYNTEPFNYANDSSFPYTFTGYVEVDLKGFSQEMQLKYQRTYAKWAQDNTLYFDAEQDKWISTAEFVRQQQVAMNEELPESLLFTLLDNFDAILVIVVLYFFFVSYINNRRIKQSIDMQSEAMSQMRESLERQHEMQKMVEQTNILLTEILTQLKR